MIDTILLDLDGTLLQFLQNEFIDAYLSEISKVFANLGLDAESAIAAVWIGTKAMIQGGGSKSNRERFWQRFSEHLGIGSERLPEVEAACDSFYSNGFDAVKSVLTPSDIPKRLVHAMKQKGYGMVLATNPLFPLCAVETRLGWTGLKARDFLLVTHYANSAYCKPDPGYFREIFSKINKAPECCLMAGNSPSEDMVAGSLGADTFLVTDCLENQAGADVSIYRRGTLSELEVYLTSLPDIK